MSGPSKGTIDALMQSDDLAGIPSTGLLKFRADVRDLNAMWGRHGSL